MVKGILKVLFGWALMPYAIATFIPALHYYDSLESLTWFEGISPLLIFIIPFFGGIILSFLGSLDIVNSLTAIQSSKKQSTHEATNLTQVVGL